jgi:hypothetical protein
MVLVNYFLLFIALPIHKTPIRPSSLRTKCRSSRSTRDINSYAPPGASLEELLVRGLLLRNPGRRSLLHRGKLGINGYVLGSQFLGGLETLERLVLIFHTHLRVTLAVQRLGLVLVGDVRDGQRILGGADGVLPVLLLEIHEGGVVVEGEAEGLELGFRLIGLLLEVGVLIQVAQTLLVFVEGDAEIAGLESLVAKLLAVGGDLENARCGDGLFCSIILGEVFVLIAVGIGGLDVSRKGFLARELTAVGNDDISCGLVALGGEVLNLADDGLSAQNFAKYNVLAVEVGGWNRRDEELGAIGACDGPAFVSNGSSRQRSAWESGLPGPAFAIDSKKGRSCLRLKFSSANFAP